MGAPDAFFEKKRNSIFRGFDLSQNSAAALGQLKMHET